MPALPCNIVNLLQSAKCLLCFTETELLAAEVVLRELALGSGRTSAELLEDSVGWEQLSQHQRNAIEVAQLMNDEGETDVTALKADLACFCSISESQLEAMIAQIKCQSRQIT